jgi:hypothetical protein
MSAFDCCATVPYTQCETAAASLTGVSLGSIIDLTTDNTSGYVVHDSTHEGYIPLTIGGIAPSCVTATLVTDAAVFGITGGREPQAYINVHIKKSHGSTYPPAWSQDIQYSVPYITGSTGQYAAGTTQLTVDLLPGSYKVYGNIQVGDANISGVTANVDARLNVVASRMQ